MDIREITESIQYRNIELDSVSESGELTGYLSTYNDIDSYGTYMMDGAFDDAIQQFQELGYLPLLWQHNSDQPIGSWVLLNTDDKGLKGTAKFTLEDPFAVSALAHARDRSVRGLSIGFRVSDKDIIWDKTRKAYGIRKISLVECSLVTFPANKQAIVTDVKNEDFTMQENNVELNEDMTRMQSEIDALKREIADIKTPKISSASTEEKNTDNYERAFHDYIRAGVAMRDDPTPPVAGNTGTNAQGGYLVPDGLDKRVIELLNVQSVIRRNATILTPEGNKYERPYKKTGIDADWVGETSSRPQTNAQTYDMITAELGELYAFPMYSQRFLADSWYNVQNAFVRDLANAFADKEESAFISGNGTNKPKGILTYTLSTAGDKTRTWNELQKVNSESATDVTLNSLIKIKDSLNAVYRPNAKWYMNTNTYTDLQQLLKDSTQRRVFGDVDVATDAPVRLLGYPIVIDDYLPDVASASNPIIFGDMKAGYAVLDRPGIGVVRDDLTNKPFIGLYSTKRVGGLVQDYRALKVLTIAVTSA